MRKMKNLVVWMLMIAMMLSMLTGLTVSTAAAEIPAAAENDEVVTLADEVPNSEICEDYPIAAQLLVNLGYLPDDTDWDAYIPWDVANSLARHCYFEEVYSFGKPETWGEAYYTETDKVTIENFADLCLAAAGLWDASQGTSKAYVKSSYDLLHVYRDITASKLSKQLTYGEAAQIFVNVIKCPSIYSNEMIALDSLDSHAVNSMRKFMGIDEYGVPTYQWFARQADGSSDPDHPLTDVFEEEPVYTAIEGGDLWNDVLTAIGQPNSNLKWQTAFKFYIDGQPVTTDFERHFKYGDAKQGGYLADNRYSVAIYDTYYFNRDTADGQHEKMYDVYLTTLEGDFSYDYEEAVELMTGLGAFSFMDATNYHWKDYITGEEAYNALCNMMLPWSGNRTPLYVHTYDTVVAGNAAYNDFLYSLETLWGGGYNDFGALVQRLDAGIKNYVGTSAMTRQEFAKMLVNTLKATQGYNGVQKWKDIQLNLNHIFVGYDEVGRPMYKWQKNGQDINGGKVYTEPPMLVTNGSITWTQLCDSVCCYGDFRDRCGRYAISMNGNPYSDFVPHCNMCEENTPVQDFSWTVEVFRDDQPWQSLYTNGTNYSYRVIMYTNTRVYNGSTTWWGIAAAMSQADSTGTITLRTDCTENVALVGNDVILDLGGKTLTGNITVDADSSLVLKNGKLNGAVSGTNVTFGDGLKFTAPAVEGAYNSYIGSNFILTPCEAEEDAGYWQVTEVTIYNINDADETYTIALKENSTIEELNTEATVDLAGYTLTINSLVEGNIIDTTKGAGKVVVTEGATAATIKSCVADNVFPVQTAANEFHLISTKQTPVKNFGARNVSRDDGKQQKKFLFKPEFDADVAYNLLAELESDAAFKFGFTATYVDGSGNTQLVENGNVFYYPLNDMNRFAASQSGSSKLTFYVSFGGFTAEDVQSISVQPVIIIDNIPYNLGEAMATVIS